MIGRAARLCELAKRESGRVLASDASLTRASPDEAARWRLGEEVVLRGRETPTRLARPAARGEINADEFEQRRRALEAPGRR